MNRLDDTNAATSFLLRLPRPIRREEAVGRCTAHLMQEHDIPQEKASILALQSYAELEAMNQTTWIDTDASTGNLVVIRQANGPAIAMTLRDILALRHDPRLAHRDVTPVTH